MGKRSTNTIEDDDLTPDERDLENGITPTPEPDPEPVAAAAPAAKADETPPEPKAEAKPEDTPPEPVAAAADEPAEPPKPFVPVLEGKVPENYDAQRKELRTKLTEARSKWSAGELSDEEFNAIDNEVTEQIEVLLMAKATADALASANEQIQRQARADQDAIEAAVIATIKAQAKGEGIDYAQPEMAKQFDNAASFLESTPKWAGKPFAEVAAEAHRMVLSLNGKTAAPAPAAAAPAAPAPAKPRDVPQTLAGLPAAGAPPIGNDMMASFNAITDPDEAEDMLERMPKAQREGLRRSTVRAH
jgi:hypothetical protein